MGSHHAFDHISGSDIDDFVSQYPGAVPSKLSELDEQRFSSIPALLAGRRAVGQAFLTKTDVATLVDWKLSHGTFRPSLKGLVQQNSDEFVIETTTAGFSTDPWNDGLNILTRLKGIGPATAALLLSTHDPEHLPFFSDELFRWAFWEDKAGCRWDRKIKYSLKEYRELKGRVDELRDRTGKGAIEAEKVAYVLGKREADLSVSVKSEHHQAEIDPKHPAPHDEPLEQQDKKSISAKRKVAPTASRVKLEPGPKEKKQKSGAPSTSKRVTRSSSKIER